MSYAPQYQKHIYKVNEVSGYYEKTFAPIGFIKLPNDLKIEPPQRQDYKNIGVRFILKSRMIKGKYPFQTGLIFTGFEGWFFGDHFHPRETQKNSFCLFRFNQISSQITVYYFNHFKLYPNKRERFISDFIKTIKA